MRPEALATLENCRYCLMCRHADPLGHVTHLETLTPRGIALTAVLFDDIKYSFVIEIRVIVMHLKRITTIVINDIGWDAFAEICFEGVHAHVH